MVSGSLFLNCRSGVGKPIMQTSLCSSNFVVKDESQVLQEKFLKDEITENLQSLEKECEQYFPEL